MPGTGQGCKESLAVRLTPWARHMLIASSCARQSHMRTLRCFQKMACQEPQPPDQPLTSCAGSRACKGAPMRPTSMSLDPAPS